MKKLGLLLFVVCLIGVGITGNKCARKPDPVTPIDTSTQTTTKKDTSGETLYITCKDGITVNAKIVPNAVLYLINNFTDYTNMFQNGILPPKGHYRMVTTTTGLCEFDTVRPATGVAIPHTNSTYNYNIVGYKINTTTSDTDKISTDQAQTYDGTGLGNNIVVALNNDPTKKKTVLMVFP